MYEDERSDYKPEPVNLLQHEFSVMVFLDYLCERPLDLIYQEKTIHQYQDRLLGELVSVRPDIRDSWVDNRIDDGIAQIITTAEQVAADNGFSQSIRKQSMKITLPLLIGFFAVSIFVMFFIQLPPDLYWLTYVIYTAMLLVICFLPRVINQRLVKRWMNLATEKGPLIKTHISGVVERFHNFIQFLINDIRQILTDNDLDFDNYRLMLFNPSYGNVKVLQEEMRKGVKFYIMEFEPLGISSKSEDVAEESDYDEFESHDNYSE